MLDGTQCIVGVGHSGEHMLTRICMHWGNNSFSMAASILCGKLTDLEDDCEIG